MRTIEERVNRLEWLLRQLMSDLESLPAGSYAVLAMDLNWTEADIDRMLDIIEVCDKAKDTSNLERDLKTAFGISYQRVKSIILTLWRQSQFTWVCRDYANNHRCSEFDGKGMYVDDGKT